MNKDEECKQLKAKIKRIDKKNDQLYEEMDKLREKTKKTWDLEEQLSLLTHSYKKGDYVVLKNKAVAHIRRLSKRKHYNVFEHCQGLKRNLGIIRTIHERDILCHVVDLSFANSKGIKFATKGTGYRQREEKK